MSSEEFLYLFLGSVRKSGKYFQSLGLRGRGWSDISFQMQHWTFFEYIFESILAEMDVSFHRVVVNILYHLVVSGGEQHIL